MQINWIELRAKKTGLTLRQAVLPKAANLTGDDEAITFLLSSLAGAKAFALGQNDARFLDVISRIDFQAAHQEYLWFAKNTTGEDGQTVTDEEELYDSQNQMLMRRGFDEVTIGDAAGCPIALAQSMLFTEKAQLPILETIAAAFTHLVFFTVSDSTLADTLAQIDALPHGAAVVLDARALIAPPDLTAAIAARPDLQFIAAGIVGGANLTVSRKGNMISVK